MGKKYPYYGKSMITNFPGFPHTMGFVAFSCTMGNWWENPCISHMMKYTIGWEFDGKNYPYYRKSMITSFPDFLHTTGFVAFSRTMASWWENPCISHMMKCTIEWELDGKKAPMLWEKYDYQFPRFSPCDGFCCIFPFHGKLMGKPMHFSYDEVYDRMGIGWEKSTHAMWKIWLPISQVFPIRWVLLHFPMLWEIDGKTQVFPISWVSLIFSCVIISTI